MSGRAALQCTIKRIGFGKRGSVERRENLVATKENAIVGCCRCAILVCREGKKRDGVDWIRRGD